MGGAGRVCQDMSSDLRINQHYMSESSIDLIQVIPLLIVLLELFLFSDESSVRPGAIPEPRHPRTRLFRHYQRLNVKLAHPSQPDKWISYNNKGVFTPVRLPLGRDV
jgi:hypothetical protein